MEPNVIDDVVAMVDGVISVPAMTREDILERDWNHLGLNSIRTMLVWKFGSYKCVPPSYPQSRGIHFLSCGKILEPYNPLHWKVGW